MTWAVMLYLGDFTIFATLESINPKKEKQI